MTSMRAFKPCALTAGFIVSLATASALGLAAEPPGFGKGIRSASDTLYSTSLSPDKRAVSVLFDNLSADMPASGGNVVSRTMTLSVPVADGEDGASINLDLRGAVHRTGGAKGAVVLWVNGVSHVFDLSKEADGNFTKHVEIASDKKVSECQLIFVLEAERTANARDASALLAVDAVDLTIEASAGSKK